MATDHDQKTQKSFPQETARPVADTASKALDASRRPVAGWVVLTAALSVASGFFGSFLYQRTIGNHAEAAESPTQPAGASGSTAVKTDSSVAEKLRQAEIEEQRSQIGALSKQMSQVQERLESLTKLNAAPNLTTLQIKVAELSKTIKDVGPLPERVDHLEARFEQLRIALESLRNDLESTRVKLGQPRTAGVAAPPSTEVSPSRRHEAAKPLLEDKPEDEKAFVKGVFLFRKGEFKEAFDIFSKLELARPDDARIWYFAALSRGCATSQWNGATQELVEKGVEREKAGTPKTGELDNLFQDLTNDTGKAWLSAYRQRVKSD